jgi:FkbM family methyltransferase
MRRFRNAMILLVKLFLDRRDDRGADEFRFRWRFGNSKHHRIDVQSRSGDFRTTVFLRKGTSEQPTFVQVFGNNDYNLRRLARWDDVEHWYSEMSLSGTPLILDLGANIGLAALYFHKNWPAAHIIAVEPSTQNMAALHRNSGHIDTVQPLPAAAAGRDGMVRIANSKDEAWAFRTEHLADPSDDGVSALPVPSIIDQGSPTERPYRPFIIKIDIEGFEHDPCGGYVAEALTLRRGIARMEYVLIGSGDPGSTSGERYDGGFAADKTSDPGFGLCKVPCFVRSDQKWPALVHRHRRRGRSSTITCLPPRKTAETIDTYFLAETWG